jgi:hypothetical protein
VITIASSHTSARACVTFLQPRARRAIRDRKRWTLHAGAPQPATAALPPIGHEDGPGATAPEEGGARSLPRAHAATEPTAAHGSVQHLDARIVLPRGQRPSPRAAHARARRYHDVNAIRVSVRDGSRRERHPNARAPGRAGTVTRRTSHTFCQPASRRRPSARRWSRACNSRQTPPTRSSGRTSTRWDRWLRPKAGVSWISADWSVACDVVCRGHLPRDCRPTGIGRRVGSRTHRRPEPSRRRVPVSAARGGPAPTPLALYPRADYREMIVSEIRSPSGAGAEAPYHGTFVTASASTRSRAW